MLNNGYCTCKQCEGDFTTGDGEPVGGCGLEQDPKLSVSICMNCRDGRHNLSYRVFCETLIYARDKDQATELGYDALKDEDYSVERVKFES